MFSLLIISRINIKVIKILLGSLKNKKKLKMSFI